MLAVVCSDLPVLREIVSAAGCGLLYPPTSSAALRGALNRLAQDRDALAAFKQRAWVAASTRFNANHEEGILLDVYRRLLEGSGRVPQDVSGRVGEQQP